MCSPGLFPFLFLFFLLLFPLLRHGHGWREGWAWTWAWAWGMGSRRRRRRRGTGSESKGTWQGKAGPTMGGSAGRACASFIINSLTHTLSARCALLPAQLSGNLELVHVSAAARPSASLLSVLVHVSQLVPAGEWVWCSPVSPGSLLLLPLLLPAACGSLSSPPLPALLLPRFCNWRANSEGSQSTPAGC